LHGAHKKYDKRIELLARDIDPDGEEERQRRAVIEAERAKQAATCGAALEDYLLLKAAKLRSGKAIERELRRAFQRWQWLDRPLADIQRRDVERGIREIAKDTPTQAHFVFGMVRTFFNWLIDDGQLETSPCSRIKPTVLIGPRNVRERVLSDHEIRALWKAAGELGGAFGPFVRLLLLSAVRRDEASEATWQEFNLASRVWEIPSSRMKNAAPFCVPLTDDILNELPPRFATGNYIFSTTAGQRPISGFSKMKLELDSLMRQDLEAQELQLENFVLHDLRRTVRTRLSSLPIEERVRELLLAHSQPGLHRVYDLHSYLDEKRHALELWHAKLKAIVAPKPDNVIRLVVNA
jgi:integrase